ncbi:lipid A deacylase LpxR family protein [Ferrovibrio sp.]|uniref:lipid A deacylase LpxR family protein n=1 Tax=Ferrovibrio sp. TaxID=1917215 RepID=UPI00345C611C
MIFHRFTAGSFCLAALVCPLPAVAQDAASEKPVAAVSRKTDPQQQVGIFSFVLENDLFYDTDRRYTNGVRLSYLTPRGGEPDWVRDAAMQVPMFDGRSDIRVEFALGQNMYTASDKLLRDPPETDRPYAGWLYGSVGVVARTGSVLDQMLVSIGVVGPAALAHETQDFIHSIVNSPEAQGWDSQLKNEPTLQFTYQRSWQSPEFRLPGGFGVDATPHAGAALGNVFTYANTGMMFRFGHNLPIDYGPPRVQPSLPGSGYFERAPGGFGWYLFAGVDGRAVARNIFLDGNTFADSRSVDKETFVGDAQFGLAMVIDGVRVAYTHVLRTREYAGQDTDDQFGAFSVSFAF